MYNNNKAEGDIVVQKIDVTRDLEYSPSTGRGVDQLLSGRRRVRAERTGGGPDVLLTVYRSTVVTRHSTLVITLKRTPTDRFVLVHTLHQRASLL